MRAMLQYLTSLFLAFVIITVISTSSVFAQNDTSYRIANSLYARADYERAIPLFKQLFQDNQLDPLIFERLANCLIYTKSFEQVESLLKSTQKIHQLNKTHFITQQHLKLAKSETDNLPEAFFKVPDLWLKDVQYYFQVGRLLSEYLKFEEALRVYEFGQEQLGINGLFLNDMAMTALQAGNPTKAVDSFLALLSANPQQLSYVQRMWIRFGGEMLISEGVLQLEMELKTSELANQSEYSFATLLLWCYQELKLHRKAFFWAKKFESRFNEINQYPVYQLASSLSSASEFDLASSAYQFYLEQSSHPLMESVVALYIDNRIRQIEDKKQKRSITFKEENTAWLKLRSELTNLKLRFSQNPNLLLQIERTIVRIDLLERGLFSEVRDKLDSLIQVDLIHAKELKTLSGIQYLASGRFTESRLELSRAIRITPPNRSLDDQAAYYLAFSEWLNEQPEFTILQLKRFKSENASYYANEAIEMRRLLIEAKESDSTYADAVYDLIRSDWYDLRAESELRDALIEVTLQADNVIFKAAAMHRAIDSGLPGLGQELSDFLRNQIEKNADIPAFDHLIWKSMNYLKESTDSPSTFEPTLLYLAEKLLEKFPSSIHAQETRELLQKGLI